MKKISTLKFLILLPFLFGIGMLKGQVTIGADVAPQAHSVLELMAQYKTGEFGGLRLPQLSTVERNAILGLNQPSSHGLMIYNTDIHCVEYWNRLKWVSLCTGQANITFDCGNPTENPFPAGGGGVGPCTPTDDPNCTEKTPPYSFIVLNGTTYLHINVVNESTGQFYVTMDENLTAIPRTGIVRITNNCTLEYKDFLFSQESNGTLCTTGATAPVIASYNDATLCSGGAVYLYLTGITNGSGYVWARNGIEVARDVANYIATVSGTYTVYAGAIGCDSPAPFSIAVTAGGSKAPAPVKVIVGQNLGYVCSAGDETQLFATSNATGTIVWYRDGAKQSGKIGSPIWAGIGKWFAVVENGGCSSVPSNEIVVQVDPNSGTPLPTPAIIINGVLAGSTTMVCSGGTLLLDVNAPEAGVTYTWYVNNDLQGTGIHFELPMTSITDDFILQCRATNSVDCSSAGVTQITISLGGAPVRPDLLSSAGTILCDNNATLYTNHVATKYHWYRNGALLAETTHPVNTYNISTIGYYTLQTENALKCVSEMSASLDILQNSGYGVVSITPQISTIYQNQSLEFTAKINPEDSQSAYTWTITGATPTTATGKTVLVTFGATGTAIISVSATNACTPMSVKDTVNGTAGIEVKPLCADAEIIAYTPSSMSAVIIGSGSTALSVTPKGNSATYTYAWYERGAPGTVLGTSATYSASVSGIYYCIVTPTCAGGTSTTSDDFTVTALTITPASSGDENQTVCMNSVLTSIVFTISGATNATVSGLPTGLSGNFSAGMLTISGTPTVSGIFNYSVTLTDGTNSGVGITGTITVNALPAQPSAISGSTSVCAGTTGLTYLVTHVADVIYTWSLPADWTQTDGGTSNSIKATAGSAGGVITVTPSSNGCTGPTRNSTTIIVTNFTQPNPVATEICVGTHTFTLSAATGSTGITYQWEQSDDDIIWANAPGTSTSANYTTPTLAGGSVTYFRRVATSSACGSITSSSAAVTVNPTPTIPTFMAYNLGANPALNTPKLQMQYLAQYVSTISSHLDASVFGGVFQWGRQPMNYAVNSGVNPPLRYQNSYYAQLTSSATYNGNGQIVTYNGSASATNFFVYNTASPYDWRGNGTSNPCTNGNQCNSLWGNGNAINVATGVIADGDGFGVPGTGANSGNRYQKPVKTVNDPCPVNYRVPTQDEWERLGNYDCNPAAAGGNFTHTGIYNTSTGLTWVAVRCGSGSCIASASWSSTTPGGYAIYKTSDWESSGLVSGSNLISATLQPLMFLPTSGFRFANPSDFYFGVGSSGYYWSSSISGTQAYFLHITSTLVHPAEDFNSGYRGYGYSVRCVAE